MVVFASSWKTRTVLIGLDKQAQDDINLLNTDVWGICNTDISQVQCDANMSWFASTLQSSCQTDLANQVATAVTTLNGDHHIVQTLHSMADQLFMRLVNYSPARVRPDAGRRLPSRLDDEFVLLHRSCREPRPVELLVLPTATRPTPRTEAHVERV